MSDQFLQIFAPSWGETWKKLAPKDAKGAIPISFFRKWKTVLGGKEFKELRMSTIWGFTLNPSEMKKLFTTFGIKKGITSVTQEYLTRLVWYSIYVSLFDAALDLIGILLYQVAIVSNDEEMVKNPNNLYWKFVANQYEDFERHFSTQEEKSEIEYDKNGKQIERTEFQKTVDGLQDIGEFLLKIPQDNLASIAVPGLADEFVRFVGSLNDPKNEKQIKEDAQKLAEDLQTGSENAQQSANEAAEQLGITPPDTTSVVKALENLPQRTEVKTDSTEVKKPDVPPTPSIKEGTASEEDKISFKNYLKDDDLFNAYNKIDQGDKPGVIIIFSEEKGQQTLYKDSEGTWRHKQSKNPY
jgi:ribosomal 50S subunit-associated protein YjgA (DUF615 family)